MDAFKTGKLIREVRAERGLTQQALAEALHVSATAVSKWENGHSLPDISLLELLAAALDIPIADIVTGERSIADMEKQTETGSALDHGETVIRSVLDESVRQRKKSVAKWVAISLGAAALLIGCLLFLLNLAVQFFRRTLLGALLHQLALDSKLQNAVFQFLRLHGWFPPSFAVISASTRSISALREARSSW